MNITKTNWILAAVLAFQIPVVAQGDHDHGVPREKCAVVAVRFVLSAFGAAFDADRVEAMLGEDPYAVSIENLGKVLLAHQVDVKAFRKTSLKVVESFLNESRYRAVISCEISEDPTRPGHAMVFVATPNGIGKFEQSEGLTFPVRTELKRHFDDRSDGDVDLYLEPAKLLKAVAQSVSVYPSEIQAGILPRNGSIELNIRVQNKTSKPVALSGFRKPCNCITEKIDSYMVPSNGELSIGITIDASGWGRHVERKQVQLLFPDNSYITVPIFARQAPLDHLELSRISLRGEFKDSGNESDTITILNASTDEISGEFEVQHDSPWLEADLKTSNSGRPIIEVRIIDVDASVENISSTVTVRSIKSGRTGRIDVAYSRSSQFSTTPGFLYLAQGTSSYQVTITPKNREDKYRIVSIDSNILLGSVPEGWLTGNTTINLTKDLTAGNDGKKKLIRVRVEDQQSRKVQEIRIPIVEQTL